MELKNINYSYDGKNLSLKDLSFKLINKEFLTIVGSNGSGKTTLSKIIARLYKPDSGKILFETTNSFPIGIVFQNPNNQIIQDNVYDDLAFGLENLGDDPSIIEEKINEVLSLLKIEELKHSFIKTLSGGQRQIIAIAGVLVMDPEIIIFDESTSMLDPISREKLLEVMVKLHGMGKTIINITHYMEEVRYSTRVLFLKKGKILGECCPKSLHRNLSLLRETNLTPPINIEIASFLEKKKIKIQNPWDLKEVFRNDY